MLYTRVRRLPDPHKTDPKPLKGSLNNPSANPTLPQTNPEGTPHLHEAPGGLRLRLEVLHAVPRAVVLAALPVVELHADPDLGTCGRTPLRDDHLRAVLKRVLRCSLQCTQHEIVTTT